MAVLLVVAVGILVVGHFVLPKEFGDLPRIASYMWPAMVSAYAFRAVRAWKVASLLFASGVVLGFVDRLTFDWGTVHVLTAAIMAPLYFLLLRFFRFPWSPTPREPVINAVIGPASRAFTPDGNRP